MRPCALFLLLSLLFSSRVASRETGVPKEPGASPPVRVILDVALSEDGSKLSGSAEIHVSNRTGTPLLSLPFFLYPNRFAEANPGLDDRNIRWIYPSGESAGKMEIKEPRWNGEALPDGNITFEKLEVSDPLPTFQNVVAKIKIPSLEEGGSGVLHLDFLVTIPKRRGRFGRWKGVVSLGGGWFPRPLPDLTGRRVDIPFCPIRVDARIGLPPGRGAVLMDEVFPPKETGRTIEIENVETDVLSLVVMDRMDIARRSFPWGTVVHVQRAHRKASSKSKKPRPDHNGLPDGMPDLGFTDATGRLFEVVDNSFRLFSELNPKLPPEVNVVFTSVPAWDSLVQLGPGQILLSDRLYKLIPVEQALWFHDLAVARGFGALLAHRFALLHEDSRHRFVAADLVGSHLAEKYTENVHQKSRTVEDLVGFASFVPTIDNLIYSPEVPFREVYSKSIEEPDPLRDEPWRFMNSLPRGKRIYGKLVDLKGKEGVEKLVSSILKGNTDFEKALGSALGRDPAWFINQWYGAYPDVNYKLGAVDDEVRKEGGFVHRAEIVREGASIREPVTVRFSDRDGTTKDVIWDGKGNQGTVTWSSRAPIKKVVIDPKRRLVETADLTEDHPLADNYDPLPWRPPMITRILFSGDLTAGDPYITFGMSLRRRYDVTNSFAFSGVYTPRSYGGSLGYYRYFGRKRTLNARTWFAGSTIGVSRYRRVTDAGSELPTNTRFAATAGSLGLVIGRDNRSYFFDPRSGLAFWARAGYSFGRDDDGGVVQMGRLAGALALVGSLAIRHTFALHVGATGLVGTPNAAQLGTLSVRSILRGFDPGETYGRVGFYAVGEYRHTLADAAHITTPVFSWLDRFQGVLFAAAGTMSYPADYTGLFTEERIFSEVGYGLRIHTLAFGVQQYVIGLDFAFPITPRVRRMELQNADGTSTYVTRNPFKLILGIMQTF